MSYLSGAVLAAPVLAASVLAALLVPVASLAQPTPTVTSPATPGVVATTNNPNLAVATLKLQTGQRLSKVIGATVYNEGGERVGSVDDLIMTPDNRVTMTIVSVGGFLGLGSKLVAVPWDQIRQDGDKIVLAGASKDSLNAMPGFEY